VALAKIGGPTLAGTCICTYIYTCNFTCIYTCIFTCICTPILAWAQA